MKLVYTIIKVVILLIFLTLALSNTHSIIFAYLPGQEITLPLIIILFIAFFIGAVLGMMAMLGKWLRLRSEHRRLQKELKDLQKKSVQIHENLSN